MLPLSGLKSSLFLVLLTGLTLPTLAQEKSGSANETVINLEPFVIFAGEMDVIDGFTGKEYTGTNPVVWGFVDTFKDYLVRYHERLLRFEIQHMNLRTEAGLAIEQELKSLTESFGIRRFEADKRQWLTRERSVLYRLNTKPFCNHVRGIPSCNGVGNDIVLRPLPDAHHRI